MNTGSMRRPGAFSQGGADSGWGSVVTWLLWFAPIVYLGFEGGGYDPLVHDQVGIVVWWIVFAGVLAGAFPRIRSGRLAWLALGLLAAFVVWTGLSLGWTESTDRTAADLARVTVYLGVFALVFLTRDAGATRRIVSAVAAAIVLLSLLALFSRLHPAWFPSADQTATFLTDSRERLSYPVYYWNALAGLIAIGLPLLAQVATDARSILARAAAAAAFPAMMLTIFFTLSRGGIVAAAVALAIFLAFSSDRLPKLLMLVVAGAGGVLLIAIAAGQEALRHGLENGTAHAQGTTLLAVTAIVCLAVGLAQAGLSVALERGRPGWLRISPQAARIALGVVIVALALVAVAVDAPGRAADGWSEFKRGEGPGRGTERLGSAAGENRYQYWSVSADENATRPLTGTGSGTFEFWWTRDGTESGTVHDAHSLYMQVFGELGIVGLGLVVAFFAVVLLGGGRAAIAAGSAERTALAAALAGCGAFCLTAAFDWLWQIPAIPVAMLTLAAALVGAGSAGGARPWKAPVRIAVAVVALAAIVAIAIPLASTSAQRRSEAAVRAGDLPAALAAARSAQNALPGAAAPRLQEALVLEKMGALGAAAAAARAATSREATNWRNWLVLSRLEAERGDAGASIRAYRRARSLNPRSEIFNR